MTERSRDLKNSLNRAVSIIDQVVSDFSCGRQVRAEVEKAWSIIVDLARSGISWEVKKVELEKEVEKGEEIDREAEKS